MNNRQKLFGVLRFFAVIIAFSMIFAISNVRISAEGEKFSITYKTVGNGKLSGTESAKAGQEVKIEATADNKYELSRITADFDGFALTDNNTFIMPDREITLTAEFTEIKKNSYTVFSITSVGGTIVPAYRIMEEGESSYFVIKADEGYETENVYVDGIAVGARQIEFFNDISANHTISASFVKIETVTEKFEVVFIDFDGSVIDKQTVEKDKSASEPKAPKREGYEFVGWNKDFDSITEDITVVAVYEEKTVEKEPETVIDKLYISIDGGQNLTEMTFGIHKLGDRIKLTAVTFPEKDASEVIWKTSDSNIALVSSNGDIAVIGYGQAKITAEFEGKTAVYAVICIEENKVEIPETSDN